MGLVENYCSHKNPASMVLHIIAVIALVYGLWEHSWVWIICGIVMAFAGHIIQTITTRSKEKKGKA
ncbi:MAG: hypothetical protein AABX07_04955 [Nanoarchaeota archaeon]